MNVLDEDIPKGQRLLLESWRVSVQQIGVHIGRRGMADEACALGELLLRLAGVGNDVRFVCVPPPGLVRVSLRCRPVGDRLRKPRQAPTGA